MKRRLLLFCMMFSMMLAGVCGVIAKGLTQGEAIPRPGVSIPGKTDKNAQEFRAVWVPYMTLDQSAGEKGRDTWEAKVEEIVTTAVDLELNTIIVHVRPFSDALYPSKIYPWSHILTGAQGMNPGYDPLELLLQKAHEADLQVHAWINPLRIRSLETPQILASNHPYVLWQNDSSAENNAWAKELSSGIYYNPAYPEVRKQIIDGVRELVERYDVDGIHMDDYFYPTQDASFDAEAYESYCTQSAGQGEVLSLEAWRFENINLMVSGIYSAVKAIDPTVQVGISPQGNLENCAKMYADVKTWVQVEGYVDYICPQLYYSFENKVLPFRLAADTWREMTTLPKVHLTAGIALYKAGSEADEGQWQTSENILQRQVEYLREIGYEGFALYSYDYITTEQTAAEMEHLQNCMGRTK